MHVCYILLIQCSLCCVVRQYDGVWATHCSGQVSYVETQTNVCSQDIQHMFGQFLAVINRLMAVIRATLGARLSAARPITELARYSLLTTISFFTWTFWQIV